MSVEKTKVAATRITLKCAKVIERFCRRDVASGKLQKPYQV